MSFFQPQHIQLITNAQELDKIEEILSWAIRSQVKPRHRLEIILFKLPEWVAVPISYEDYLTPYLHQLHQTLLTHGYQELWGVVLLEKSFWAYKVSLTIDSLMEFNTRLGGECTVLFSGEAEPDFTMLNIESELYILSGKKQLICQILEDIDQAYNSFNKFVSETPMLKTYLQRIAHILQHNYENSEIGTEFRITP